MNRDKIHKKLVKGLETWCASDRNTVVRIKSCTDSIRAALRSSSKGPKRTFVYLESIANTLLSRGQVEVLKGTAGGWEEILRALNYYALASAIQGATERQGSLIFALAFALRADHLGDLMAMSTLDRSLEHMPRNWDLSDYPPFAFSAFSAWRGVSRPDLPELMPNNPYAPLMPGSAVPSDLGGLVARLADRHLEEAEQGLSTDDGYPDFGLGFEPFPVELMWLRRIWTERGVAWPDVDHPLLNSPLYHPPKDLDVTHWRPGAEDAVYSEVRAAALKAGLLSDKAIEALPA